VRLGDLFEGIGEKATVAIAHAPAPGVRAVYNATRLASFAYSHGIAWRPVSRFDRVIVKRASQIISGEEIHAALRSELEKRGIAKGSEIEFTNRRISVHLPIGVPATLAVQNLNYERRTGRFTATVTAPANHPSATSLVVTGRVYKVIEVPVLNRRVPEGEAGVHRLAVVGLVVLDVDGVLAGLDAAQGDHLLVQRVDHLLAVDGHAGVDSLGAAGLGQDRKSVV